MRSGCYSVPVGYPYQENHRTRFIAQITGSSKNNHQKMPRGKPTTDYVRGQIIALRQTGMTIAKKLKLPRTTVGDMCNYKKFHVKGMVRVGKPRTRRDDRYLFRLSLQDRYLTAPVLKLMEKRPIYCSINCHS